MPNQLKLERILFVRVTKENLKTLKEAKEKSGYRSLAEWARHILMREAVYTLHPPPGENI